MKEVMELKEATEDYFTQPVDDNLFEWHFTVRGPEDTDFSDGYYHGRIILPPDYPMKPPSIILLTPNGRFELNKKICLSISGHHPESWQPSWSIRTALLAIIGFMPTHGNGAIGSIEYTPEERKLLAKKSQEWTCKSCGEIQNLLKSRTVGASTSEDAKEAKKLASQINFKEEEQKKDQTTSEDNEDNEETAEIPDQSREEPETIPQLEQQLPAEISETPHRTVNMQASLTSRDSMLAIIGLSVAIAVLLLRRMISYF
ncbi:Ubiquitin-conjugating enzyme E2 J1 [Nymphon striatum]|nr:Ubiquitin-conjugating enzyme E2 J1 [Nymphon striatum]